MLFHILPGILNMSISQAVIKPSICPLDCPDTCSLAVTVEHDKVVKVKGSQVNPFTDGVVCGKVSKFYPDFVHGKHRLMTPLRRIGEKGDGKFEKISWDEAIKLCYQGIQKGIDKYGTESAMPLNYSGPHGQLAGGSMDRRFFYKLGATQLERSTLCAGVRSLSYTSLFGQSIAMPQEQAEYSDLIILWGTNTSTSFLHLMKVIKKARKRGAKVIVIDPKRIKVAGIADLYLQIQPSTDAFFALAMAAELDALGEIDHSALQNKVTGLEEYLESAKGYQKEKIPEVCGIESAQVEQFIDLIRHAKRMSMLVGVGLERSNNGGSAIRSAMALSVLLGQFGKLGQGQMGYYSVAYPKTTDKLQRPDFLEKPTRTFSIVDAADHILDRDQAIPITSVFIYNHNPVCVHPDQNKMIKALSHDDVFVIGCDINMTDSMKYADVILPAASHFETGDVYTAYGHNYLQRAEPVIDRVGEALPNTEIFRRLAKQFGFDDPAFKESDAELMEQSLDLSKHDCKQNSIKEIATEAVVSFVAKDYLWLSDLEAGQMINLYSDDLEKTFGYGLPAYNPVDRKYPFTLVTAASFDRSNSTFGGSVVSLQEVNINTQDAKELNIESGQKVLLKNNKGEVVLKAHVSNDIPQGVVFSAKGAWCESSPTGQTVNALLDNQYKTDIGNGAAYYNAFVDLESVI